jgi:hypothetical protein
MQMMLRRLMMLRRRMMLQMQIHPALPVKHRLLMPLPLEAVRHFPALPVMQKPAVGASTVL